MWIKSWNLFDFPIKQRFSEFTCNTLLLLLVRNEIIIVIIIIIIIIIIIVIRIISNNNNNDLCSAVSTKYPAALYNI